VDAHRTETDWAGVALGLAVASLAAFQMLKLAPALPVLIADYGYSRVLAGAMMSIYAVAALLLSLLAGGMLARRPALTLATGLGCFVIGNCATLLWPDKGSLVLGARAVEGVGYAVLAIAGPVISNRSAAERHHPFVAGVAAVWVPVGQITALVAARFTLADIGWQALWWLSLALVALLALWLALRWTGVREAMSGIATGGTIRWSRPERAAIWVAAVTFGIWSGQYIAFMTWLPDYFVGRGAGAETAAVLSLLPVLGVAVSCLLTGWLSRHVPYGALFVVATLSQVPVWLFADALPPGLGLAAIAFFGLACGVTPTLLFALPPRVLGGGRVTPAAFAPLMAGRNLGILASPPVAGWLIGVGGWSLLGPVFGAVTLAAVMGGALMAHLAQRR
jgi:cyanate permease